MPRTPCRKPASLRSSKLLARSTGDRAAHDGGNGLPKYRQLNRGALLLELASELLRDVEELTPRDQLDVGDIHLAVDCELSFGGHSIERAWKVPHSSRGDVRYQLRATLPDRLIARRLCLVLRFSTSGVSPLERTQSGLAARIRLPSE
jgi:hypothetical protein